MPRCSHCGHEFVVSEGFRCPSCGDDWRATPAAPSQAQTNGAPAHLAILDGGSAPAASPEPKPRLVSSAGPAVPVLNQQNDSVPSGWMARLEAARMVARGDATPPPLAANPLPPARPSGGPPPLKPALAKKGNGLQSKPAHLLVARLEEDEQRRQSEEQARLTELFEEDASEELISQVEVDLPTAPKKKKIPDWVVMVLLGGLVLGGIGAVFSAVRKEPAPKVTVDPELQKAAERRKQAIAALETAHGLAIEGKPKADAAIAAYEKALALEPTLASAERGIAIVYASKDDDANAVQHYRRYLELAPDAKDAPDVKAIIERWERSEANKKKGRR